MPYKNTKVYSDGGHYIAIPPENFPSKQRKRKKPKTKPTTKPKTEGTPTTTPKEKFETAYKESQSLPKRERKKYIAEKLKDVFKSKEATTAFIDSNIQRKKNNAYKRYTRLWRKVHLQKEWSFFVTFTYSDEKLTEKQFKAKLRNTLKHAVSRNGWKYIGVFERAPETERLHFHGIFYIPQIIGEIVEIKDYSTKSHRMQTTYQNTHFLKEFGRNDFKPIDIPNDISQSVKYLLKYIEKSGEKLVYGGKLPTYFKSDILDEDIACGFGVDEKKLLLFDNFECIDEGVLMGKVSREVIEQMPKDN